MDALLSSLLAAALAEWGDRTQLFVVVLAARYLRPAPILAGLAVAALANSLVAAYAGLLVADMIPTRAASLLVALALILAGAGSLIRRRPPDMTMGWRFPAFVTAAIGLFLLEFGDKTQFITFALGARYESIGLTAAGAAAGILAAGAPAALLGRRLGALAPLQPLRYAIAALFLTIGFIVAVGALELV